MYCFLLFLVVILQVSATQTRPSFVLVLTDDQDQAVIDAPAHMPTLRRRLAKGGTYFAAHAVDSPQCGPSRAALLTSRLPHNTGFFCNSDPSGASRARWQRHRNDTMGSVLTAAGYHTAFIGKWVNGDGCSSGVPRDGDGAPTWSHWAQLCNIYAAYNSSYTDDTLPAFQPGYATGVRIETGVYQSDSIAAQGVAQMDVARAAGKPFFLYLAPSAPHEGTCNKTMSGTNPYPPSETNYGLYGRPCPAFRHRGLFLNETMPHLPNWNVSVSGGAPPSFSQWSKPISANVSAEVDITHRARLQALRGIDDMLETLFSALDTRGLANSTYVLFTTDNGYHMGQHRLPPFNKRTPYEHDVSVPLFVAGPNVSAGRVLRHATQHVDIGPTLLDLAGCAARSEIDGRSFAPLLDGNMPPPALEDWARPFTFTQFSDECNTWWNVRNASLSFHTWCTNQTEAYDLAADPYQVHNIAPSGGWGRWSQLKHIASAMAQCAGDSCRAPREVARDFHKYPKCYLGLCAGAPHAKGGWCGHYQTSLPSQCGPWPAH